MTFNMQNATELLDKNILEFNNWFDNNSKNISIENFADWIALAEQASAKAFNSYNANIDYVKIAVRIYESLKDIQPTARLSAVYLRIRALKIKDAENNAFFEEKYVEKQITEMLDINVDELASLSENWQKLSVNKILQLRTVKNWINVLEEYEAVSGKELKEFSNLKRIKTQLP